MIIMLPITLMTASVLTLIGLVLAYRVGLGRAKHLVNLGDGGNADMVIRIRSHANFVEYVPLALVLMGLLELAGANKIFLTAMGGLLILFRVCHPIGMPMEKNPNVFRAGSAIGTFLLIFVAAIYGLFMTLRVL